MENYPFIKCTRPRVVRNRYTGKKIQVPCGCCDACLVSRAQKMSFQCTLEELDHPYCMFVTLTYDNYSLPKATYTIEKDDIGEYYVLRNASPRLRDRVDDILAVQRCSEYKSGRSFFDYITSVKIKLGGYIPYAPKIDLQLFLKRLRKRIFKDTYEKIRYYAVSEYGPVHFRPHFHLLLFFESPRVLSCMQKHIRASWTYGRVDASLSRGKCSSYVAGYVNSRCSLPLLYTLGTFKPFCLHSQFFAKSFYKSKRKEIYNSSPFEFMSLSRSVAGKIVDFMPWRSLTSYFFPRCKGYDGKSYGELRQSYTILRLAQQKYGFVDVPSLVTCIVEDEEDSPLIDYFSDHCYDYANHRQSRFLHTPGSIASELYLSKHFLEFCCGHDFSVDFVLRRIIDYYKTRDYCNLITQYIVMDTYINENRLSIRSPDWYKLFYPDTSNTHEYKELLRQSPLYEYYVSLSSVRVNDMIKHKKLNDINKILFC